MSEALAEDVADDVVVDDTVEVAPEAVEETVAEATPAPASVPVEVQAELEYLRDQNAQIVQYLQANGASPAEARQAANEHTGIDPAQLVDEYGNLDPSALAGFLSQRDQQLLGGIRQEIAQLAAPLQAREQAETIAEGEQRLNDILADDIARNGEFVNGVDEQSKAADTQARQLVRTLAENAFPEVAGRYGMTPKAAEIALNQAADQVRGLLKAAGAASVQADRNHAATLAGVRSEPNPGGTGVVVTSDEILPPGALARKYAADATRIRNT